MENIVLTDLSFWIPFVNIIIIDLILSGDNAMLIGMAVRNLPPAQRKSAIFIGASSAVIIRTFLTLAATYLMKIPLIMSVGGVLLLWISVKLVVGETEDVNLGKNGHLGKAIRTIIIADLVMSLDNVLAVAGTARGNVILVLFGLAFSIPLIMWGSKLLALLLKRFSYLVFIGSGILGYTAGELIVGDKVVKAYILADSVFLPYFSITMGFVVILMGLLYRYILQNR